MTLFKRNGFILLILAMLWTVRDGLSDGSAYLVRVFPTPLRFAKAVPRRDPTAALPPLKMFDEMVLTNKLENVETNSATGTEEISWEQPIQNALLGAQPPRSSDTTPNFIPNTEVTPQMLLRFFTPAPAKQAIIPMPFQFTPPTPPGSSRESSAVYISQ